MKLEYAVWNLNEAKEHIESLITELKKGRSVRDLNGYCLAWVQEIYWHAFKPSMERKRSSSSQDRC